MLAHPLPSPVRLEGRLDPGMSRWLWLVKWFLVIPHALVLAFLWAAFFVLSVVAVVIVAFTGRYPRSIFDFNLGVLRWTWRVGFYAYSALGTDRYPPFTLDDVPDYPARLEIAYPEHLPHGFGLLRWWIVALPHYLIVALFAGGGIWLAWGWDPEWAPPLQGGVITLLALMAGVVLLFTGRYPRGMFDLLLGLDRWVVRVGAYAALMTDAYPPFRLDAGDADGTIAVAPPAAPDEPVAGTVPRARSGGSQLLIALGALVSVVAVALVLAGGATLVASATQRDGQGYLMAPSERFSTTTYALSTESVDTHVDGPDWLYSDGLLGKVRIRATAERPIFVGIAPTAAAERYLAPVRHETVDDYWGHRDSAVLPGGAPRTAPADAGIWVASASGAGTQRLTWAVEDGDWSVVLMNRDGSANVDARLSVGARLADLGWIGAGLIAGGLIVGGIAAAFMVAGLRRPGAAS